MMRAKSTENSKLVPAGSPFGSTHGRLHQVLATTSFTPDAVAFAKGKPIELVDRKLFNA
jgi:hypothetical protein